MGLISGIYQGHHRKPANSNASRGVRIRSRKQNPTTQDSLTRRNARATKNVALQREWARLYLLSLQGGSDNLRHIYTP